MTCSRAIVLVVAAVTAAASAAAAQTAARTVVLVVIDGLRWQEVFTGADSALIARASPDVRRTFWRESADARRETLMPFLWRTVAQEGVLFGNRAKGSAVRVSNGRNVSYPGYDEILTGRVDERIRDNRAGRNRNETVLDWLNAKPRFVGHVAAYGTWQTFDDIFNRQRAGFVVRAGWRQPYEPPSTPREQELDRLFRGSRRFKDVAPDALMQQVVLNDVPTIEPRALFVGFGETDEWAHQGRYDEVLRSAHTADSLIAELWQTLQAMSEYRGATTLIITTDHGRGATPSTWRDHDEKTLGSDATWVAMIGPEILARGEAENSEPIVASQIAATVAAAVGESYAPATSRVAPAIIIRR